ncbi:sugar kinase [Dactylosporangium fulvum]|uniref:Sugar kinase n=1 Tax=Dactylosporangium fulvum TaxID=53359 RepID=A0ABY5VZ83_9ACTN|nr:sugar kinase [Dactylosporangium fulvum]UWP83123.1 sugar kinase [Dactylosporangium fulvum]
MSPTEHTPGGTPPPTTTRYDAICIGESMALVAPDPPAPLARGGTMRLDVAGAESTVASYLAQLGARVAWVSRVGEDPLGRLLRDRTAAHGVDVSHVDVDPTAPTGVFFKDPGEHTTVHYYRAGSAASRLGPELFARPAFAGCRVVHLSGITPALSASCAALVDTALTGRPLPDAVYSFDVNHRPALWSAGEAGPVLARLADRADVTFVGLDEATRLWGTRTPDEVRALLPGPRTLVVKDGAVGVTSYRAGRVTFAPAVPVDVVEPVGAGDAYAAGYLYGLLTGLTEPARLRLGHLVAGAALRIPTDVATLTDTARLLHHARTGGTP